MERWTRRVALVTGASAGIGAALVKALVKQGMKVVGCARNVERIQALANELKGEKGSVKPIKCDVTKEEEILAMFSAIKSDPEFGGVDVCINNAGLAHPEPLLSGNSEKWREMIDVNVLGVCMVTREAYKSMQERKVDDGHIFIINSISGHVICNNLSAINFYSLTKHAVTAMLDGIRHELREANSGIRITGVSPGSVETEFAYRMLKDTPGVAEQVYKQMPCLHTDDITNTVIFALQSPPHMQIHDVTVRPTMQKVP